MRKCLKLDAERKTIRTEQITIRQQMEDHAATQGLMRVEAEVRRLCREAKASAKARRWAVHKIRTQVRVGGKEGWFGCGRAVLKNRRATSFPI